MAELQARPPLIGNAGAQLQALFDAQLRLVEGQWLGAMVEPLTEREREVLRELSEGDSNAVIAQRLRISRNTVASHLRNIYQKIGTSNRLHAALAGCALRASGRLDGAVKLA